MRRGSISKRAEAPWPKGSFQEELGLWQQEWFYITAPRGSRQKPPPVFCSGPPQQLTSWVSKGRDWWPPKDVPMLQDQIRGLQEREINLVVVAQVMLIRRLLSYKHRPLRLWEIGRASCRERV